MEVYLIRHGIAVDRELYTCDEKRPLTEKGYQRTQKIAQRLNDMRLSFDLILTSPLVRAKQTAKILQDVGLSSQVQEYSFLAPDGTIEEWINWFQNWEKRQTNRLALVGHQPNLGNWTEQLLWGCFQEKLIVKKAGIIGLNIPITVSPIQNSNLFLLVSPKWLI